MALTADVVVVGAGLAGACAAWAARDAGGSVLVIARAPGATAVSSGCIDVAQAEGDLPIGEAATLLSRQPQHPYGLLGVQLGPAIDAAMTMLQQRLSALGLRGAAGRNLWLPTPLGKVKPAALAQGPIALGDLRTLPAGSRLGVVALCGAQVLEARLMAKGLHAILGPESSAVVLEVDFYLDREDAQRSLPEIASDLDRPGRRARLGEALDRAARSQNATHVLVPTVGLLDAMAGHAELAAAAGRPIFELLGAPPSVPGLRLSRAIEAALDAAGVRRVQGIAERSASGGLQIVRGTGCEPVSAKAIVLASGRFLGGGVVAGAGGLLTDSALGLPAFAGERRKLATLMTEELFALKLRGRHAGLAAGLRADHELRALDEQGRPATAAGSRIFACGAAIGGHDAASGDGGLGVCAVTGAFAGARAAEAARC